MTDDLSASVAFFGSTRVKTVRKMLVKSTQDKVTTSVCELYLTMTGNWDFYSHIKFDHIERLQRK